MRFAVTAVFLILSGCATTVPLPPRVASAPTRAVPPPVTVSTDWRDWPVTPGNWSYRADGAGRSTASFGSGLRGTLFAIGCDTRARAITLSVVAPPGSQPMTIRTTSLARTLPTTATTHADGWPPVTADAQLSVTDSLLDAMGFSRGHFVVQTAGSTPLVIPAWAEFLRVTEDCRG